jgi:hypothetical protein
MKRWLRAQPAAATIAELQAQLDAFVEIYNHHRPHRSLPHRSTPAIAYTTRPKANPTSHDPDTESRVRTDRVSASAVTLRIDGHLHHIGIGRTLEGTRIILLIDGYDVPRDPRRNRRDHPHPDHRSSTPLPQHRQTRRRTTPPLRTPKTTTVRTPMRVRTVRDVSRHHIGGGERI